MYDFNFFRTKRGINIRKTVLVGILLVGLVLLGYRLYGLARELGQLEKLLADRKGISIELEGLEARLEEEEAKHESLTAKKESPGLMKDLIRLSEKLELRSVEEEPAYIKLACETSKREDIFGFRDSLAKIYPDGAINIVDVLSEDGVYSFNIEIEKRVDSHEE